MNKEITSVRFIFLILIAMVYCGNLYSDEIHIPVDFPTIEEGINAAADGDSVIVAPGMWYEHLTISDKSITLGSWFLTTGDTSYIRQTTLNGSNSGRVIAVDNAETGTSICGFTIRNGRAVAGAAIWINSSTVHIDHTDIVNNTAECGSNQYAQGGGIACYSSNLTISDFTFSNNQALCSTPPVNPEGGAIFARDSDLHLIRGKVFNNYAYLGGGLGLANCNTHIQQVDFVANEAPSPGGGICAFGGGLSVMECIFRENQGEGITSMYEGWLDIQNSLFTGNTRGAISTLDHQVLTILNSTIAANGPYRNLYISVPEARIYNSIIWGDGDTEITFSGPTNDLYLIHSLVKNGTSGISGNAAKHIIGPLLSEDPLFADTVAYSLSDNSPCIGAGIDTITSYPNLAAPLFDLDMNPRPNPAGSSPDLGARERELGSPVTGLINQEPLNSTISVYQPERGIFRITGTELNSIAVFSVTSELVYFSDNLNTEQAEVNLKAMPGGIYLLSMVLNNHCRVVRKVVVY